MTQPMTQPARHTPALRPSRPTPHQVAMSRSVHLFGNVQISSGPEGIHFGLPASPVPRERRRGEHRPSAAHQRAVKLNERLSPLLRQTAAFAAITAPLDAAQLAYELTGLQWQVSGGAPEQLANVSLYTADGESNVALIVRAHQVCAYVTTLPQRAPMIVRVAAALGATHISTALSGEEDAEDAEAIMRACHEMGFTISGQNSQTCWAELYEAPFTLPDPAPQAESMGEFLS